MREGIRLFMILLTIVVILLSWITGTLARPRTQLLIITLIAASVLGMVILNIMDASRERKKRETRKSRENTETGSNQAGPAPSNRERATDVDYSLSEKKQGLTWGGGNIHASEARRGSRRKFLGK